MKDELKYIFSNVNEWLKFAEAKHAGIIVFNSAIIIGVITSYKDFGHFDKCFSIISIFILGISVFGSLIAQFPETSNFIIRYENIENPNLYFFGHLAVIKQNNFIDEFKKTFPTFNPDNLDKQLINQILVNSKIALSKYTIFKWCSYTTIIGIGILSLSTLIKIWQ